jgi:uncharacterized membrane-anchored protein YhcB (DUF1043 family)
MSRIAMWLVAGVAVGLIAGVVAGRYSRQPELQAMEKNWREQADAARQRLADLCARFDRQTAQVNELQREGDQLRQHIRELETALQAAKDEAEVLRRMRPKPGSDEVLPPPPAATLNAPVIRVVDVNLPLQMLMVDVGAQSGMQAGMSFYVVHDKTPVAEVHAAEVRETFSGMVIEKMYADKQPVPGDRLIARKK